MSATGAIAVEVPDIGDYQDVPIIEILVSPGDEVAVDDPLLTLESDKATMDVPAPLSGVVRELHVNVGDRVSRGTLLLTIEPSDGATPSRRNASAAASDGAPSEAAAPDSARSALTAQEAASAPTGPVYASPAVRRLARELGVDLSKVTGTGRKGRITKADVQLAAGGAPAAAPTPAGAIPGLNLPPWPSIEFEKLGPVERVPRSRIQKISASNLARNWVMIPHVTHNDEADITELEAWRRRLNEEHAHQGVKVTILSFLILASAATLKEFPTFNSSLDGDQLILKHYCNIAFAADTPNGLVAPVIKDADRKGLLQIARELTELSTKARAGKLGPPDITGSTFTISSLGGIGGTSFTPIINAPEVAILGATRATTKPIWNGNTFEPRLTLPLSLSYDHRANDGAAAARFLAHLARTLNDLRRALL